MGLQVSQHKSGIHYAVRSSSCPSSLECEKNVNVSGHTERTFCPLQKFHVSACVCECVCVGHVLQLFAGLAGCTYIVSLSVCCVCRVIHTESAAFLVDNFFVVCVCVCECVLRVFSKLIYVVFATCLPKVQVEYVVFTNCYPCVLVLLLVLVSLGVSRKAEQTADSLLSQSK